MNIGPLSGIYYINEIFNTSYSATCDTTIIPVINIVSLNIYVVLGNYGSINHTSLWANMIV